MDLASLAKMSKTFEHHLLRQPMDDDDGDEFEHGDAIANARHEDPSDYSVHQFLASDDARGVTGSDEETASGGEDGDDGAAEEVERNQAEAQDDDFGSEDTPEDSFLALKARTKKQPMDDDDGDEFEHGDAIANARHE